MACAYAVLPVVAHRKKLKYFKMEKIKITEKFQRVIHWFREQCRKNKSKRFYRRIKMEYMDYDIPFEERHNFKRVD